MIINKKLAVLVLFILAAGSLLLTGCTRTTVAVGDPRDTGTVLRPGHQPTATGPSTPTAIIHPFRSTMTSTGAFIFTTAREDGEHPTCSRCTTTQDPGTP